MFISRYKIQKEDKVVYEEFMKNPFGPHSPRLQRVLNLFRGCGKLRYGLYCVKPYKEWMLITMNGPSKPTQYHEDVRFSNLEDAEKEIFKRRWEYHTKHLKEN